MVEINAGTYIRCVNEKLLVKLEAKLPEKQVFSLRAALESARSFEVIDGPFHKKMISRLRKAAEEPAIAAVLGSIHLSSPIARVRNFFVDAPVTLQVSKDIINGSSLNAIAAKYGMNSVEISAINHPDFRNRLAGSLALQVGIYTWPRLVIGYSVYAGLLLSSEFRSLVGNGPFLATAASMLVLSAGVLARTRIDYKILQEQNMSPDLLETTLANLKGDIRHDGQLQANAKMGFIGAPLDVAISSCAPAFAWAWFTDVPYSIPAYLLAMYVDQVVFTATNLGWGSSVKIIEKLKKKYAQKTKN